MIRNLATIGMVAAALALACEKKETAATASSATQGAAPAAPTTGANAKCKQAAEHKAKLKDPNVDPSTLGSVEFDKQDCESGKWSPGRADCILAAKDYDTAKQCQ